MKTIVIGDIHGRNCWQQVVEKETFDKIIFIGDYFDSFTINFEGQMSNFNDILELKKQNPDKIELLLGNHDGLVGHYSRYSINSHIQYSGFQSQQAMMIRDKFEEYNHYFKLVTHQDSILFSHAGVTEDFLTNAFKKLGNIFDIKIIDITNITYVLNEIKEFKPQLLQFKDGGDPYGDDVYQSTIWVRPRSLMKGAESFKKQIIQVVGHTTQNQIDIKGKATGGRYYFIDTLNTSGEVLVIEDGVFSTLKLNVHN